MQHNGDLLVEFLLVYTLLEGSVLHVGLGGFWGGYLCPNPKPPKTKFIKRYFTHSFHSISTKFD